MAALNPVIKPAMAALALAAFVACPGPASGDTSKPPAKTIADTLAYSNPSGSGYTLVRNAASTAGHLVLDVMGPATPTALSGVGFQLSADQTKVTWTSVGSDKVNSSTFTSTLVKTKVSGDTLQAAVFQKGLAAPVTAGPTTVLAQVALDLKPNTPVNTAITLSAPAGKAVILNPPANPAPTSTVTLSLGSLVAN